MLRVYSDFNARTPDDACWLLLYKAVPLAGQIQVLGLTAGSTVILFQDEDDFEVLATLDRRYVDILGREAWVAIPDWSTKKDVDAPVKPGHDD